MSIRSYIVEYIGEPDPFKGATNIEFWGKVRNIKMKIETPNSVRDMKLDDFVKSPRQVMFLAKLMVGAKLMHPTQMRASPKTVLSDVKFIIQDYFYKLKEPYDIISKKGRVIRINPEN